MLVSCGVVNSNCAVPVNTDSAPTPTPPTIEGNAVSTLVTGCSKTTLIGLTGSGLGSGTFAATNSTSCV